MTQLSDALERASKALPQTPLRPDAEADNAEPAEPPAGGVERADEAIPHTQPRPADTTGAGAGKPAAAPGE